jgi:hypothetical protein
MHRRSRIPLLLAAAALVFAACGDDSTSTPATQPDSGATLPPVDTTPDATEPVIEHPTGADDVVLRIAYEGGFVPVEYLFLDLPTVLVTGDGRVIVNGPVPAIFPGPLLPNMQQRTITEDGLQTLLRLADEHDLFRDVTYAPNEMVADAPDTVVTIAAAGGTFEHRAYALGMAGTGGDELDPDRARLAEFVAAVTDFVTVSGGEALGPEQPYPTETYLIRATPSEPTDDSGVEPTVVDWPADTGIALATASDCAAVPAAAVGELFVEANQLTWFTDAGTTYQLIVKPQLPGVPAC